LKNADIQPIFAHSASAVTPSKKVQLTLIGSPLYALSNEPKMNSNVDPKPPKGALKRSVHNLNNNLL